MGVYIKGMGMPKYGDTFKVYLDAADDVLLVDTSDSSRFYTLVEVKAPHGDLIDRDELIKKTTCVYSYDGNGFEFEFLAATDGTIVDAPTVIEAEGNDG